MRQILVLRDIYEISKWFYWFSIFTTFVEVTQTRKYKKAQKQENSNSHSMDQQLYFYKAIKQFSWIQNSSLFGTD